ncbi:hypothetical protein N24_1836 [Corynebacterium suranareeae]|uniref:Uncharacterized protein n=1 Tax=Corynebacterium suranareeae TaxID=2506452 RepID=A0A169RY83_9CORY|nr:hypothetical protein [Corynebacterium suranareeae]BAU96098.1 hypothetical protein N24_1836 [Corynebacterium suranareeae]
MITRHDVPYIIAPPIYALVASLVTTPPWFYRTTYTIEDLDFKISWVYTITIYISLMILIIGFYQANMRKACPYEEDPLVDIWHKVWSTALFALPVVLSIAVYSLITQRGFDWYVMIFILPVGLMIAYGFFKPCDCDKHR